MMNKILRLKSAIIVSAIALFITSCGSDSNDDIFIDPTDPSAFDGELSVFETGTDNRTVSIDGANVTGPNATVKVAFKASSNTMRRLYVTQNVSDFGAEPYNFAVAGVTVDDKKDGSLDLSSDNGDEFEFAIPFPVPTSADSQIVYTIWATTGRGDFRDVSKRNAISDTAVGTITITGSGNSTANGVRTYSNIKLEAPAGDGSSMTFFSLYTGEVYKINPFGNADENSELLEIWDFGYYYGQNNNSTLASVFGYNLPGVDLEQISGLSKSDFNQGYFKKSDLTNFDTVTATELNGLSISTADGQELPLIQDDWIIEFQDQYGKKGLIRVEEINPGNSPNTDFIVISIKIEV